MIDPLKVEQDSHRVIAVAVAAAVVAASAACVAGIGAAVAALVVVVSSSPQSFLCGRRRALWRIVDG